MKTLSTAFFSRKLFRGNKYEFYISFLPVLADFILLGHRPHVYVDELIKAGSLLIALLCMANALFDIKRMNWLERVIAIPWFCLLLYVTPLVVWDIAHIEMFADR